MNRFAHCRYAAVVAIILLMAGRASADNAPAKIAPPDAKTQAASIKLVESTYKDDIANAHTPADKTALATKFIAAAAEAQDKPVERFALYSKAREIAEKAADARTAFAAIEKLDGVFEIDAMGMKAESLAKVAANVGQRFDPKAFVERCDAVIDDAMMQDKFELAKKVGDSETAGIRKFGDAALLKLANARAAEVRSTRIAFDKQKLAAAVLSKNPDDPNANLVVGKYLCFVKSDWKSGLPLLAKGGDAALKSIAEKELVATNDAQADAALADAWVALAAKTRGERQNRMQRRAVKWYDQALAALTGLEKVQVEKKRGALMANVSGLTGRVMTPEEVMARFTFPNKSFKISGETVTGETGNYDDPASYVWLEHAESMQAFEYGLAMKAKSYQAAVIDIDGRRYRFTRGFQGAESLIDVSGKAGNHFPGAIKNPNDWAWIKMTVEQNKITISYNGAVVGSCDLETPMTTSSMVKVGFSSHNNQISVKDVYIAEK